MDCSPPGSSIHAIFQAGILEWVAISSSRESSQPRYQIWVSWVFCIGRVILYHSATWEAPLHVLSFPNLRFRHLCEPTTQEQELLRLWEAPDKASVRNEWLKLITEESSEAIAVGWGPSQETPFSGCTWQHPSSFRSGTIFRWATVTPGNVFSKENQNLLLRKGKMSFYFKGNPIIIDKFFPLKNQESVW